MMKNRLLFVRVFALMIAMTLIGAGSGLAATYTWLGTVDTDWNSTAGSNWDNTGDGVADAVTQPATGDDVVIKVGVAGRLPIIDAAAACKNLTFDTTTGAATLSVNAVLTLDVLSTGITVTGTTNTVTISGTSNIVASASIAVTNNSTTGLLTISANQLQASGGGVITFAGTGNITVSGIVKANGGSGVTIAMTDVTDVVTFSGANDYIGATAVTSGTLNLQNITAAGTTAGGVAVSINAQLELQGGIAVGAEALTLAGGSGVELNSVSGSNTWGGTIAISADSQINSTVGGTTLTVTGAVSGAFNMAFGGAGNITLSAAIPASVASLTKSGAGVLLINGANLYTGATSVTAGTLRYNGGATLVGTAVTVSGTGTFDIGAITDTVGAVTLTAGSITGTTGVLEGTSYAVESGTITAILAGAVNLTKTTSGTVTLSGVNTYTGITTINAGVLSVATIGNGAVAGNLGAAAVAAANIVLGGGTLQYTGVTASTTRAYTLTAATTSSIEVTSAAATLTISGVGAATTGALTKSGAGTLILSGANLYTGLTTITAGTLTYGVDDALATGAVTVNGGTLNIIGWNDTDIGTVTLTAGTITGTTGILTTTGTYELKSGTVSAILAGAVALNKTTAGTVIISKATTNTGLTTVSAGTLQYGITDALASGAVTVSGTGTLDIIGFNDTVGAVTLTAGTITGTTGILTGTSYTVDSGTISAILAGGAVALTKNTTGLVTLSKANTYTGDTNVVAGTLETLAAGVIADGSNVVMTNAATAILKLGGAETIASLSGGGTTGGNINLQSFLLTVTQAADLTYGGIISGTGGLTKAGGNALTLSGSNTYTGPTTVAAGTLSVATIGNGGNIGNLGRASSAAANLVLSGGTLQYTGATASTDRNFTLTAATTSTIDVTVGANTLTMSGASTATTGAITKIGAGTLILSGANNYSGLTTVTAGTLNLGNVTAFGTGTGGISMGGGILQLGVAFSATAWTPAIELTGAATIDADVAGSTIDTNITNGANLLTITGGENLTISGALGSGAGGLTVNMDANTDVITMSGTNTYTGITTITKGTLSVATIGNGGVAGNLGKATNAAANLVLNASILQYTGATASTDRNFTLTNAATSTIDVTVAATTLTISGASTAIAGNLTKIGAGTLALSGTNLHTGITTINGGGITTMSATAFNNASPIVITAGTLTLGGAFSETIGNLSGAGNIVLGSNTLTVKQVTAQTFSGVISGTGGLTIDAASTALLTLNAAQTYSGTTTVNQVLTLGASGSLADDSDLTVGGAGVLTLGQNEKINTLLNGSAGSIVTAAGKSLTIDQDAAATVTTVISGGGGLTIDAGSTALLTLNAGQTYTGTTTVNYPLSLTGAGTLADASKLTLGADGVLTLGANETINSLLDGSAGRITTASFTLTIVQTDAATVTTIIQGTGGLTIDDASTALLTLNAAQTYTGKTTLSDPLTLGPAGSLFDSSILMLTAATDKLTLGQDETIGGLDNAASGEIAMAGHTLTIKQGANVANATTVISGAGSFIKDESLGFTLAFAASTLPTVTGISPVSGSTAGGLSVNISGTNFVDVPRVTIGGVAATSNWVSSTSITATTPAGTVGAKDVVVTNPDNQFATLASGFSYYDPALTPTITSIIPNVGSKTGGIGVTITGTLFNNGATVTIGGTDAAGVYVSATSITATTPASATAGAKDVVVTNTDNQFATLASGFSYYDLALAPTVSGIVPNSGTINGGTSVNITGTNFLTGATVTIGGTPATVTNVAATLITATTPTGTAGAKDVVVTNLDTQSVTSAGGFTYVVPTLSSIAVTPAAPAPSIALGLTQQFTATGTYSDATTQDLTATALWVSATPATATIGAATGLATSVAAGTTIITAAVGAITSPAVVLTVTPATLLSIVVTPAVPTIALGQTQQFVATGTYTDATTQVLTTTATWVSATPATATIGAATGLATSLAAGTTSITAAVGAITSSAVTLTVTDAILVSIAVTPVDPSVAVDQTQQFIAIGTYGDATTHDLTSSALWVSATPAKATIGAATGLATGVATGTTIITAAVGAITSPAVVLTVTPALVSIAVTPAAPSIVAGLTQQFIATGTYADASTKVLTATATWISATPATATIAAGGLATGVAAGTTSITAAVGAITSPAVVLTVTPVVTLVSIAVTPAAPSIMLGLTQQFTATGTYSDATTQVLTATATWVSATPATATIAAGGLATSVAAGTTSITAAVGAITSPAVVLTVTPVVTLVSIAVTPAAPSIALGLTQQFIATGTYSDATTQVLTTTATWVSATPATATIGAATGLATSVAAGTTSITAAVGAITSPAVTLTVTPSAPTIVSVVPAPTTHNAGAAQVIAVTVTTINVVDATAVTVSFVDAAGALLVPAISAAGAITSNSAVVNITVPATVVAGNYQVKGVVTGVTNPTLTAYVITPISAPTIVSVFPSIGPSAGGTSVTITGTNFASPATVTIGGAPATTIVVVSATSITAITPAGTLGDQNVVVTTPGGTVTKTGGFRYYDYFVPGVAPTKPAVVQAVTDYFDGKVTKTQALAVLWLYFG